MPRPTPRPVRDAVFRLWQQGQRAPQIAAVLGIPLSTVYRLIQRLRHDGVAGIPPRYRHPAIAPSDVVNAALELRRGHSTWGAEWICAQLLDETPGRPVPSDRTLRRWFVRADLAPAPAGRRPKAEAGRTTAPHNTWQMDAKEHIILKNKQQVSWLRVIDECSGAVLHTTVFPLRGLGERHPRRRARGTPSGVCALGTPRLPARRQWRALGVVGRLPHRPVVVGARAGDKHALEPSV
jgi:transposase